MFSRFALYLPVLWTINFDFRFGFKLDSHFDSKLPALWAINFDSRFDYKLGPLPTCLFAVSLSIWIPPRPWAYSILICILDRHPIFLAASNFTSPLRPSFRVLFTDFLLMLIKNSRFSLENFMNLFCIESLSTWNFVYHFHRIFSTQCKL